MAAERRIERTYVAKGEKTTSSGTAKSREKAVICSCFLFLQYINIIAFYNMTGSRGRNGAAEKWSRRKGCPHFMDQCLLNVDWVGFLLLV